MQQEIIQVIRNANRKDCVIKVADISEIKPSFSLKYIVLTAITALIVGAVSLLVTKLSASKTINQLTLEANFDFPMIGESILAQSKIQAKYYLKDDPEKEIRELYRKSFTIHNSGNAGADNIQVSVVINTPNVHFVADPRILSKPKSINNGLLATKNTDISTNRSHYWNISLLNPGESATFEYAIYSEEIIKKLDAPVVLRKKDWVIIENNDSILNLNQKLSTKAAAVPIPFIVLAIFLQFALLAIVTFQQYKRRWEKSPQLQERYTTALSYFLQN